MRGKPPSIASMVDGSLITPGRDAIAVAPGIDEAGIESVPGSDTGTDIPGTIAAGTAWGTDGEVIAAPGAEAVGIGALGCDIGAVVPGAIALGIASGTGGDMMAAQEL